MTKLYFPQRNDFIIGIVESKISSEFYRININSTQSAIVSNLDFKNVVKRNKQILEDNDAIYGQVSEVIPDSMITCKESVGLLKSGMIVKVNCKFCSNFKPYKIILDKYLNFDCLVGKNGFIYINHEDSSIRIVLYNFIKRGEYMNISEFESVVIEAMGK